MSDPQTTPKKTQKQILQEQIDEMKKKMEALTSQPEDAVSHINNCPTCKAKAKAALQDEILKEHQIEAHEHPAPTPQPTREEVLKGYLDSLKDKKTCKCKGCGMIVTQESEKCPFCGSTEGTTCGR